MRVFFAVFPPPDVVEALARTVESIRRPGDSVSWVKAANIHYTLRFLGELGDSRVAAAGRAGEAAVVGLARFALRLGAPGLFPNPLRPRVLWLGTSEGGDALRLLARSLDEALRREGFAPPDKPFAPHLTLGRVREGGRAHEPGRTHEPGGTRESGQAGAAAHAFCAATFPSLAFEVAALALIHSTLDPRGSIYAPIGRFVFV